MLPQTNLSPNKAGVPLPSTGGRSRGETAGLLLDLPRTRLANRGEEGVLSHVLERSARKALRALIRTDCRLHSPAADLHATRD